MRIKVLKKLREIGVIFTFSEAYEKLKYDKHVLGTLLYRLEKEGYLERLEKGKYIIIPLDSEKDEYTPHEFVIGSNLIEPYAIAYWSALHYYGLTDQIPNKVFIQSTNRKKKTKLNILGINYKITKIIEQKFFGNTNIWIEDKKIWITDQEKTLIDCLDRPQYCGGINNLLNAFENNQFNHKKLIDYSTKINNTGVIRRLGFLCDKFNIKLELPNIDTRNYLLLDPTLPKDGPVDAKWKLRINLKL